VIFCQQILLPRNKKEMSVTIPVTELYVKIPQPNTLPNDRPLKPLAESPYYLSLKNNDANLFRQYAQHTSDPSRNTWVYYQGLVQSIHDKGFQANMGRPISVRHNGERWHVHNGHHRVAILRYLYGSHSQVIVRDNHVIGAVLGPLKPNRKVLPKNMEKSNLLRVKRTALNRRRR
jgi:hypothetical protein